VTYGQVMSDAASYRRVRNMAMGPSITVSATAIEAIDEVEQVAARGSSGLVTSCVRRRSH
jgi:hypothetical protein